MQDQFIKLNKDLQALLKVKDYMLTELSMETNREQKKKIHERIIALEDKMNHIAKELVSSLED